MRLLGTFPSLFFLRLMFYFVFKSWSGVNWQHNTRCLRRAHSILRDPSHPGHHLFELLPSGRHFRTIKAKTNRLKNSFYPRAVIALNSTQSHNTWTFTIYSLLVQYSEACAISQCVFIFFYCVAYIYIYSTVLCYVILFYLSFTVTVVVFIALFFLTYTFYTYWICESCYFSFAALVQWQ